MKKIRTFVNGKIKEIEIPEEQYIIPVEMQIQELKQKLSETDYIACKIAEGVATTEEYADIIQQRQAWREEINRLSEKE